MKEGVDYWRRVNFCSVNVTERVGHPAVVYQSYTVQRSAAGRAGGGGRAGAIAWAAAAAAAWAVLRYE